MVCFRMTGESRRLYEDRPIRAILGSAVITSGMALVLPKEKKKMEITDDLRKKIEAKKKTHIFYDEWCEWFIGLNPSDVSELAKGLAYLFRGEEYEAKTVTANTLLKVAKPLIDANREGYVKKVAKQIDGINHRWEKEKNKSTNSQVIVDYKPTTSQDIVNGSDIELELDIDSELNKDYPTELLNNIIPSDKGLKKKDDKSSQKESRIQKSELEEIVSRWNTLPDPIPKLTVLKPGTKRYESLTARVAEYGIDNVMIAIEKVRKSSFLCGKSSKWHISFDWLVLPNNFPKVLEGNYTDGEEKPKVSRAISVIDDMIAKGLIPNDD